MSSVFIDAYDLGIVLALGGELVDVPLAEGGTAPAYGITVSGSNGTPGYSGRVAYFFVAGHGPFVPRLFPCVIVRRQDPEVAMQNGGQAWSIESQAVAPGSTTTTVTLPDGTEVSGPSHREVKETATPFNLPYDIQVRARGPRATKDANALLKHVLRTVSPPGFSLSVTDSDGEERTYDAVVTSSLQQTSDVIDLAARDIGWTVSIVVHGELDLADPQTVPTVTAVPVIGSELME